MTSLDQVLRELEHHVRSEVARMAIVTRLILRTGINLKEPREAQIRDARCVARVIAELDRMGIKLDRKEAP